MTIETRKPSTLSGSGPYIGEVVNTLDSSYMGALEVSLYKNQALPSLGLQSWSTTVQYLSPFYGVTSRRFEGNNSSDFNDVQKSYGMWMIPPDVGTKVMVIFVNGDTNQGYWIGCIQDQWQNHMVPGIAASKNTQITAEQERRYGTSNLPVAEIHKGSQTLNDLRDPYYIPKAVHPFAERLLAQGLLIDNVRGITSSSARREVPSQVFGISTPGPIDKSPGAKKGKLGFEGNKQFFVSRLGGSTFVMDDGDEEGQNELVRIRTRTGHQILLHNSHDLIYIGNSKGTAWIELTSNGKIDIYSQDSISIHTETDFNFRADRDINLEAGRDINVSSGNNFNLNVGQDYNVLVDQNGKISCALKLDISSKDSLKVSSNLDLHLKSTGNINATSNKDINLLSNGNSNFTTNGNTNISSVGNHVESADKIYMNGPAAEKSAQAESAETPDRLPLFVLPNRNTESGWSNGNFYAADPIFSIMQRVPTHEPWAQHENINPDAYTPESTDSFSSRSLGATSANPTSVPFNPDQPVDWREDKEFIEKAKSVAKQLNADIVDFLAVLSFETGRTFNPSIRNKIGATGLIQFLPSTAKGLGITTDYLAGLTRTEQLDWVLKYYQATPITKISSPKIGDLYAAVLWPRAVGQPDDYVLFKAGTLAYQLNPIDRDTPKKGYATKADAVRLVESHITYIKQTLGEIEAKNA